MCGCACKGKVIEREYCNLHGHWETENAILRSIRMQKHVCEVCGYEYDPAQGEGDIPAGTPFEKLPGDWTCPVCGAPRSEFSAA